MQQDLQRGDNPDRVLEYYLDTETGDYALLQEYVPLGEPMGITPDFPPDRLDIMKARAQANGYTLKEYVNNG